MLVTRVLPVESTGITGIAINQEAQRLTKTLRHQMETVILTMEVNIVAGRQSSLEGGMEKMDGARRYLAPAALFDHLHLFRRDAANRAIDAHNVSPAASLADFDGDFEIFAADAEAHAEHRRRADGIEPHRHAHIGLGGTETVGRIKADPADIRDESLRPGMAGLLLDPAVGHLQVAGDVARRNVEVARGREKNVAMVAADAALEREGFARARHRLGHLQVELHFTMKSLQQSVRLRQSVALAARTHPFREIEDRFIRRGQSGGAQEQARRKALDGAADDTVGVVRFDFAVDVDA